MTKAMIMQPHYLPWVGYFAMLDKADVCVLLDTVQFSKQSWQQRNRIRLPDGQVVWLTVPVHTENHTLLKDVRIDNSRGWQRKHLGTLTAAYGNAPQREDLGWIRRFYRLPYDFLADLTFSLIVDITQKLGIETSPIIRASSLGSTRAGRTERLQDILRLVEADSLLEPRSGTYLEHAPFHVEWFDYEPQPYDQGDLPWMSHLSVVDLLAHTGSEAISHIRAGF